MGREIDLRNAKRELLLLAHFAVGDKLARIRDRLPDLRLVLAVGLGADADHGRGGALDFDRQLDTVRALLSQTPRSGPLPSARPPIREPPPHEPGV